MCAVYKTETTQALENVRIWKIEEGGHTPTRCAHPFQTNLHRGSKQPVLKRIIRQKNHIVNRNISHMHLNSNLTTISSLQSYKIYPVGMRLYKLACRGAAVQPVQAAALAADKGESKCRPGSNRQARMPTGHTTQILYTNLTHILLPIYNILYINTGLDVVSFFEQHISKGGDDMLTTDINYRDYAYLKKLGNYRQLAFTVKPANER